MVGNTPPIIKTKGTFGYEKIRAKIDSTKTKIENKNAGKIYNYFDKNGKKILERSCGEFGTSGSIYFYTGDTGKQVTLWDYNGNGCIEKMRVGEKIYNNADEKDTFYTNQIQDFFQTLWNAFLDLF